MSLSAYSKAHSNLTGVPWSAVSIQKQRAGGIVKDQARDDEGFHSHSAVAPWMSC